MNKWLSLPELMQRWQTDLIENVFETIRAGLPVYEYIDVGGTPDALELRPKDFMDRFQAVPPAWEKPAWATGIKPLRSGDVRFLVDDVETFEQAHDGARRSTRQDSGETINHAVEITRLFNEHVRRKKPYTQKQVIQILRDKDVLPLSPGRGARQPLQANEMEIIRCAKAHKE